MRESTRRQLLAVNREFYRRFAGEFSASRSRAWSGWDRVLEALPRRRAGRRVSILDLGCGNGRFGRSLLERRTDVAYTGIDPSPELLAIARRRLPEGVRLQQGELGETSVAELVGSAAFDGVVLFGVLHHVPGRPARRRVFQAAVEAVAPGGLLAVSFWRFADDESVAGRIVPWTALPDGGRGLPAADEVDDGDHLVAWGRARPTLRYCHHVADEEIDGLSSASGLTVEADYRADGARGRSNRYVLLRRVW